MVESVGSLFLSLFCFCLCGEDGFGFLSDYRRHAVHPSQARSPFYGSAFVAVVHRVIVEGGFHQMGR